jgi:hypothetical protein
LVVVVALWLLVVGCWLGFRFFPLPLSVVSLVALSSGGSGSEHRHHQMPGVLVDVGVS